MTGSGAQAIPRVGAGAGGDAGVWCPGGVASGGPAAGADMIVEAVYAEDRASLEGFVRSITRDEGIAQEICQEAFVRLLCEVRAGRSPDNPRAWLRRVAANLAISRGRHNQVADRKRSALVSREIGDSAETAAIRREDAESVARGLARLPTSDRSALLMAAAGLSGAEIGRRMGRSEGAARTVLCRARHKLRLVMEPATNLM
jgi:RNA polymerase sigma-70 factor (ECF subfamily)